MEQNYTPLNLNKFEENKTTTFLLVLAIITLAVLATVLFLFIQKRLQEKDQIIYRQQPEPTPEVLISPSPTLPSPTLEQEPTPQPATVSPTIVSEELPLPASDSPTPIISPTIEEMSSE